MKYLFILAMVFIPVLVNAQTLQAPPPLVSPTLVRPRIDSGLINGTAIQIGLGNPGCLTTAVAGNCCTTLVTYPLPFNDTNINSFCVCAGTAGGEPILIALNNPSVTTANISTCTPTATASGCSAIVCLGVHQ